MRKSMKEALTEVDNILELMDAIYVDKIPVKIRKFIKENKDEMYNKEISSNKSLEEQDLKHETLTILGIINYNYWCDNEQNKKALMRKYVNNEKKYRGFIQENMFSDIFTENNKNKIQ